MRLLVESDLAKGNTYLGNRWYFENSFGNENRGNFICTKCKNTKILKFNQPLMELVNREVTQKHKFTTLIE